VKEEDMIRLYRLPLLLALTACTVDNYSVILLRNVAPTEEDGQCIAAADENAVGLLRGVLDVTTPLPDGALNPGYILSPIARNGTSSASPDQSMVGNPNVHIFFVEGAETELIAGVSSQSQEIIDYLAGRGLTERTYRFSTSIPPNGLAGLSFQGIDEEQTAAIAEILGDRSIQIVVRVQVFGQIDNDTIRTPVFEYPITLCRGCLVQSLGDCMALPPEFEATFEGCNPVQDNGSYPCCTSEGTPLCPAISTAPPPPE
jgi:hypothetical protein